MQKCDVLDERLFAQSRFVEVRQARWHPGSRADSHLVVLTSDNVLRLYEANGGSSGGGFRADAVSVQQLGRRPEGGVPGCSRLSFLAGLGETGTDFDFGPPKLPPETRARGQLEHQLVWPVYVLRGNGCVYTLDLQLDTRVKPVLKGPLGWYPPHADDSFEHCSIMCFKTGPVPVVALSTLTGTIYHCVVLAPDEEPDYDSSQKIVKYPNYSVQPSNQVLHVFESVELELGLALTDKDSNYCCPIFLHPDDSNKGRYFCSHETGIHVVNVPLVVELENILENKRDDLDTCFSHLEASSDVEYLLCTRATGHAAVNPVMGFSLSHYPTTMIAFLASGQMVTLLLVSHILMPSTDDLNTEDEEQDQSPFKKLLHKSFEAHIGKLLKSGLNQPIIKLSPDTKPNPKECHELLTRATNLYREQHFKKFDKIREEMEKRMKALQMMNNYQQKELQRINSEKQTMQELAESIAEKYEDIKDKQELLTKRCERLLILVSQKQPKSSDSENNLVEKLKKAEEKTKEYCNAITQLKRKQKYQETQMVNWNNQMKKDSVNLGSTTENTIMTSLNDMYTDINELVESVHHYKQMLGLQ